MKISKLIILIALTVAVLSSGCEKRKQMNESRPLVEEAIKCMNLDQFSCAVDKLKEASQVNEHADIYYLLGNAYRGRYDETFDAQFIYLEIEAYQKSITLDPKNMDAYKNVGDAYFQTGDCASAKEYYEKALSMNPPDYVKNDMNYAIKECERSSAKNSYYDNGYSDDESEE